MDMHEKKVNNRYNPEKHKRRKIEEGERIESITGLIKLINK